MSLLGEFFGSLFGVGYLGFKILKEETEIAYRKSNIELCRSFIEKYTDPELEVALRKQIADPSQRESLYQRVERYKRTHTLETVWFPIEFFDFLPDEINDLRKNYPYLENLYTWVDIGTKRIPDRTPGIEWLMFTYEKLERKHAERFIYGSDYEKIVDYLRKNRDKYGI